MTELFWNNGTIQPLATATANVEDRGSQFADGVYEVIRVYRGVPFTMEEHLRRLERSAKGINLSLPMPVAKIAAAVEQLLAESGMADGMVYMQLTRGVAPRNHVFPEHQVPSLYFYNRQLPAVPAPGAAPGVKLVAVEDERWKRCWVKAIALLPNVLAKNHAVDLGADEAAFVENGVVTECSTSNLFVIQHGELVTAPVGQKVLPGVTRQLLLEIALRIGIPIVERAPTEYECRHADELFITSTTREVSWVSHWNGRQIATEAGPATLRLHKALQERVRREIGTRAPAMAMV